MHYSPDSVCATPEKGKFCQCMQQ